MIDVTKLIRETKSGNHLIIIITDPGGCGKTSFPSYLKPQKLDFQVVCAVANNAFVVEGVTLHFLLGLYQTHYSVNACVPYN